MRQSANDEAFVDLTPMLDVIFIMLIFFIVTASFINEQGITAERPHDGLIIHNENTVLEVRVAASGEITFKGRHVDIRALRSIISAEIAATGAGQAVLRVDQNALTKSYAPALDAIRAAGVMSTALLLSES